MTVSSHYNTETTSAIFLRISIKAVRLNLLNHAHINYQWKGPDLSLPNHVKVMQCQRLLLRHKTHDFLQFLHILRLMQAVSQHYRQYSTLLYPLLQSHTISCVHCHNIQQHLANTAPKPHNILTAKYSTVVCIQSFYTLQYPHIHQVLYPLHTRYPTAILSGVSHLTSSSWLCLCG